MFVWYDQSSFLHIHKVIYIQKIPEDNSEVDFSKKYAAITISSIQWI